MRLFLLFVAARKLKKVKTATFSYSPNEVLQLKRAVILRLATLSNLNVRTYFMITHAVYGTRAPKLFYDIIIPKT